MFLSRRKQTRGKESRDLISLKALAHLSCNGPQLISFRNNSQINQDKKFTTVLQSRLCRRMSKFARSSKIVSSKTKRKNVVFVGNFAEPVARSLINLYAVKFTFPYCREFRTDRLLPH
jgi:hypothetical protein